MRNLPSLVCKASKQTNSRQDAPPCDAHYTSTAGVDECVLNGIHHQCGLAQAAEWGAHAARPTFKRRHLEARHPGVPRQVSPSNEYTMLFTSPGWQKTPWTKKKASPALMGGVYQWETPYYARNGEDTFSGRPTDARFLCPTFTRYGLQAIYRSPAARTHSMWGSRERSY